MNPVLSSKNYSDFGWFFSSFKEVKLKNTSAIALPLLSALVGNTSAYTEFLSLSVMLLILIAACDKLPYGPFAITLWVTMFLPSFCLQHSLFQWHG